jgi:hypothetical protein
MKETDDERSIERDEALSKVQTYKKPIHPDFSWWKERERAISETGYRSHYHRLRSRVVGEPIAPPEDVLRKLDQFESLLAWLENKPIGQQMTAYEKAKIVCKLVEMTSSNDLSVSLESGSIDVNLQGDSNHPIWTKVEGAGGYSDPLKIMKEES